MANITFPVTVTLKDDEAMKLVPSGAEITVTICDECCALVPLALLLTHHNKVHDGS